MVFRKKDLYLIIAQKLTFLISWNPPYFTPEIRQISPWNPPDFTPEICRISPLNLPDFTGEIHQISHLKSASFHPEIRRISRVISKDQLPGMVSPMFLLVYLYHFIVFYAHWTCHLPWRVGNGLRHRNLILFMRWRYMTFYTIRVCISKQWCIARQFLLVNSRMLRRVEWDYICDLPPRDPSFVTGHGWVSVAMMHGLWGDLVLSEVKVSRVTQSSCLLKELHLVLITQ